jgi:hypothetical protein
VLRIDDGDIVNISFLDSSLDTRIAEPEKADERQNAVISNLLRGAIAIFGFRWERGDRNMFGSARPECWKEDQHKHGHLDNPNTHAAAFSP